MSALHVARASVRLRSRRSHRRLELWHKLHELLTGRTPYEGKPIGEIIASIREGEPRQLNNDAAGWV
ncbi:MAG TPA: hypothetical protein VFH15_01155 [Pyrinomonadaceae bacterium]|nr:hypothetical protein [Pyrinomonadaceae bacterium]